MSGMAHFFVVVSGSNFHERLAHFFIDIYTHEELEKLMPWHPAVIHREHIRK